MLRRLGWEERLTELRAVIGTIQDVRQRGLMQLYAGWLGSERGTHADACDLFDGGRGASGIVCLCWRHWRWCGCASGTMPSAPSAARSGGRHGECGCDPAGDARDIAGQRAAARVRFPEGLEQLYAALEGFGPDHFGTGRVLDTLGTAYAYHRDDFPMRTGFIGVRWSCRIAMTISPGWA